MIAAGRRAAAAAALCIGAVVLVGAAGTSVGDARSILGDRATATRVYARFVCLRDVVRTAVPDLPTYIEPQFELPEVEWYQRATEMAFDEVPLVDDPADADQVLTFVLVQAGTGTCDDVDVRLDPR